MPGAVIASTLDAALAYADYLGLDAACEAIRSRRTIRLLCRSRPNRLPDQVRHWVDGHPHLPHDSEIDQAILAVQRVRAESERRELWNEDLAGRETIAA